MSGAASRFEAGMTIAFPDILAIAVIPFHLPIGTSE
jgi:hypothetical protein